MFQRKTRRIRGWGLEKRLVNNFIKLNNTKNHTERCYLATHSLPTQALNFIVNAYQARIWNLMANFRMEKYGWTTVFGDLIKHSNGSIYCWKNNSVSRPPLEAVVLPLYSSMKKPHNMCKDLLREVLREDGINVTSMRHVKQKYGLYGSYRRLIVRPHSLSVKKLTNNTLNKVEVSFTLASGHYATTFISQSQHCNTSK